MDIEQLGCEGVAWIYVTQNRRNWWALVSTVMHPRVLQKSGSYLTS